MQITGISIKVSFSCAGNNFRQTEAAAWTDGLSTAASEYFAEFKIRI